jgi:hypothetical protein
MSAKIHRMSDKQYAFHCPGCACSHGVYVDGTGHPVWQWNKSLDRPTFTPSILVTYPANPKAIEEFKEWRTERRCHSFVKEGMIQFLADSTHKLAGQTVPIPDWED